MANYWISTTWSSLPGDEEKTYHVFLTDRKKHVPKTGDIIYFRQSKSAPKLEVLRHEGGHQSLVRLQRGGGGIVARAIVVDGLRRELRQPFPDNIVVYNFGNLERFTSFISCGQHDLGEIMDWPTLSKIADKSRGPAFNLYKIKEEPLVAELERRFKDSRI